jgi:pimeloyl-ACP methyl ester carboxylesterase
MHNKLSYTSLYHIRQGHGDPVILIHGIAASLHGWNWLIPELAAHNYTALAIDLPGHGDSPKPDDPGQYTVETFYSFLDAWIESQEFAVPPVLVGHSLGGYLSLDYTLRHPGKVRALVLIDPLYNLKQLSPFVRLLHYRPEIGEKAIRLIPEWLVSALLGWDPTRTDDFPRAARQQIAADYKRASSHIVYVPGSINDLSPLLSQVIQPSLVIWGEKDLTLRPKSFQALADTLPNASRQPVPGAGHQPHIGRPALVNRRVLDFLAALQPISTDRAFD